MQVLLSWSCCSCLFASNSPVLTGSGSCRECKERVSAGAPSSSGPFQVGECENGLVALLAGQGMLASLPVAARGAEGAHGGRVAAAFGGEVTAVAEHVRPAAQSLEILMRVAADREAGGNQPP